ncbi:MAG: hypothetical protein ACOY3O_07435, partial [Thermodesulfobacteriota bacterium]
PSLPRQPGIEYGDGRIAILDAHAKNHDITYPPLLFQQGKSPAGIGSAPFAGPKIFASAEYCFLLITTLWYIKKGLIMIL